MNTQTLAATHDVRQLESSVTQLSTALSWLSASLVAEASRGSSLGMALAAQMDGPMRALSIALINLNDGIADLLVAAEEDLRRQIPAQPDNGSVTDSRSVH